jgi:hypothetical protein
MKTGYGSALGDYNYGAVSNLVFVNQQFARGPRVEPLVREATSSPSSATTTRWPPTPRPDAGEGLLLVGLNDSGAWQTRNNVQTAFEPGTVLKDYSIYGGGDLTVNGSGQVNLSIPPGNNGQGWVCYAPRIREGNGDPLALSGGRQPGPTMPWVVPGGRAGHQQAAQCGAPDEDTVDIDVHYQNPADSGGGCGDAEVGPGPAHACHQLLLARRGHRQRQVPVGEPGQRWAATAAWASSACTATLTNMPEGLHLVQARAFVGRAGTCPRCSRPFARWSTWTAAAPTCMSSYPAANQTVEG